MNVRTKSVQSVPETFREIGLRRVVHFIGFRGEEYWSAVKVWGPPDMIHMGWDRRAQRDISQDDIVIFAKGDEHQPLAKYNYPDIIEPNEAEP